MNTTDAANPKTCQRCGGPMAGNAPEGLCARCLLSVAIKEPSAAGGSAGAPSAPAPEELAQHFPQFEILELLGRGQKIVAFAKAAALDDFIGHLRHQHVPHLGNIGRQKSDGHLRIVSDRDGFMARQGRRSATGKKIERRMSSDRRGTRRRSKDESRSDGLNTGRIKGWVMCGCYKRTTWAGVMSWRCDLPLASGFMRRRCKLRGGKVEQ